MAGVPGVPLPVGRFAAEWCRSCIWTGVSLQSGAVLERSGAQIAPPLEREADRARFSRQARVLESVSMSAAGPGPHNRPLAREVMQTERFTREGARVCS